MLTAVLTACAAPVSEDILSAVEQIENPEMRYLELLRLDREHPNSASIQVEIADYLLRVGRSEEAQIYLDAARSYIDRRTSADVQARVLFLSAMLAYQNEQFAETSSLASAGLDAIQGSSGEPPTDPDIEVALLGLRGSARVAMGEFETAIEDFANAEERTESFLTPEILSAYARAYLEIGNVTGALETIRRKNQIYGYDYAGILDEVVLYERLDLIDAALLSLAIQFEEARFEQGVSADEIVERFQAVARQSGYLGSEIPALVSALYREDWDLITESLTLQESDHPFARYMIAVAGTRQEAASNMLASIVALEDWFRRSQGYYYFLWTAFRNGSGIYNLETMGSTLEKTILLSPESPTALATREELAILMGYDTDIAPFVLLREEVDQLIFNILRTGDPASFTRLYGLLALPDNRYTTYGVVALTAATTPSVREVLEAQLAISSGRLAERLRSVLST